MKVYPQRCNIHDSGQPVKTIDLLSHALYMLDEIPKFIESGRMEKANRWIGFLQGILWSQGIASVQGFMNMNRPVSGHSEQAN